jgi:hypothetical protein
MSIDFGMGFTNQTGDVVNLENGGETTIEAGGNTPKTLILFNALRDEAFNMRLSVDGVDKGTFRVGAYSEDHKAGRNGECTVFALFWTSNPEWAERAAALPQAVYGLPGEVKALTCVITSLKGVDLTVTVKVRLA